jgi:hypothetical protein
MPVRCNVFAFLGIVLAIFSATASAQDEKNQVTGSLGRIFISDQGIQGATYFNPFVRSGKGLTFELSYARRLFATPIFGISAEVPVAFNLDEDLNSGADVVPTDYQQIFVSPAARLNFFPLTKVSPWLSFGGGFAHFSENRSLIYGGANPAVSTTSGVVEGGLGVDVRPFRGRVRRLGVRGEVRDFWSGTPDLPLADTAKTRQHNYFLGGGATWNF